MKTTRQALGVPTVLLACMGLIAATMTWASDTPPTTDWQVVKQTGVATVTPRSSAVTLEFDTRTSPPFPALRDLLAGGLTPDFPVSGNLLARGFSGMSFFICGIGPEPAETAVIMIARSGRYWRYRNISVSAKPGEWTKVEIPLLIQHWELLGNPVREETRQRRWLEDMADVESVILRVQARDQMRQAYSIRDFRLLGPGRITEPANLTSLQEVFGVNNLADLTDEQLADLKSRDSDGDGMSDYDEIVAGFNPFSAESVFAARVARGEGANTISWEGVLGKRYAIWRSNDLRGGFTVLKSGIVCAVTGLMSEDDEAPVPDAPNFYKVVNY